jgi:hypothetical protein
MGIVVVRILLFAGGLLLALIGLAMIAWDRALVMPALWALGTGMAAVIAAMIERHRYRSAAAESTAGAAGPGGGEPLDQALEPRFRPTEERFVDPSTRQPMRVWLDPSSGERRYRADA